MSADCRSPLPPRECASMLLTMPSARRPCSAILARLPVSMPTISSISARVSSPSDVTTGAAVSFSSSSNSTERSAKLLTKLSGFFISWAMPAVNCPSAAIFSPQDQSPRSPRARLSCGLRAQYHTRALHPGALGAFRRCRRFPMSSFLAHDVFAFEPLVSGALEVEFRWAEHGVPDIPKFRVHRVVEQFVGGLPQVSEPG